jgi:peptide/nickel transport system permease protein
MTATIEPVTIVPDSPPAGPARSKERGRGRLSLTLKLVPLGALIILAVVGPIVGPYATNKVVARPGLSPSGKFWFGTDSSGFDVFSRTLAAFRLDTVIGVATTVIATVIGIALGLLIGMNESRRGPLGLAARFLARCIDLLQALPAVIIGLVVVAFYGASSPAIIVAISIIVMPLQCRLVRTEVLRVRTEAYLEAGRVAGLGEFRLTVRHVLPNSSWPAIENGPFLFGVAVILTAALGFLGVGVPPPTPEWGSMLSTAASDASVGRWWGAAFPTLALIFAVAAVAMAHGALTKLRRTG